MSAIYIDLKVRSNFNEHPAMSINDRHPCVRMKRESIEGKSVFHWNRDQAYQMYKWYCEGWKSMEIVNEFGDTIYDSDFKRAVEHSHYLLDDGTPSPEIIKDLHAAIVMEKKILESIGKGDDDA